MGALLTLPLAPRSARSLIMATCLSDEEVATQLSEYLLVPIRAGLVQMWRTGAVPDPGAAVLDALAQLIPQPPPVAARRAS